MDHEGPICQHFQRAAELVGQRWVPQVVWALQAGTHRFTDLRDAIPSISDTVLSTRLKELEAEGIVRRTVEPTTPVRISYELTERGHDLAAVMRRLSRWAERWTTKAS